MKILFWTLYQLQVSPLFGIHTPHLPSSILITRPSFPHPPTSLSGIGSHPHHSPAPHQHPPPPSNKLYPGDNDAVDRSLFKLFIRRFHAFSDSSFAYYVYMGDTLWVVEGDGRGRCKSRGGWGRSSCVSAERIGFIFSQILFGFSFLFRLPINYYCYHVIWPSM